MRALAFTYNRTKKNKLATGWLFLVLAEHTEAYERSLCAAFDRHLLQLVLNAPTPAVKRHNKRRRRRQPLRRLNDLYERAGARKWLDARHAYASEKCGRLKEAAAFRLRWRQLAGARRRAAAVAAVWRRFARHDAAELPLQRCEQAARAMLIIALASVRTIYDYEAIKPDELNLSVGALVYVVRENDDGWHEGVLNGVTGLFPSTYCMREH